MAEPKRHMNDYLKGVLGKKNAWNGHEAKNVRKKG